MKKKNKKTLDVFRGKGMMDGSMKARSYPCQIGSPYSVPAARQGLVGRAQDRVNLLRAVSFTLAHSKSVGGSLLESGLGYGS